MASIDDANNVASSLHGNILDGKVVSVTFLTRDEYFSNVSIEYCYSEKELQLSPKQHISLEKQSNSSTNGTLIKLNMSLNISQLLKSSSTFLSHNFNVLFDRCCQMSMFSKAALVIACISIVLTVKFHAHITTFMNSVAKFIIIIQQYYLIILFVISLVIFALYYHHIQYEKSKIVEYLANVTKTVHLIKTNRYTSN
jgi:hypothetical protein